MTRLDEYQREQYRETLLVFARELAKIVYSDEEAEKQYRRDILIEDFINKCMDIQRADVDENYNPFHGEEQGVPF